MLCFIHEYKKGENEARNYQVGVYIRMYASVQSYQRVHMAVTYAKKVKYTNSNSNTNRESERPTHTSLSVSHPASKDEIDGQKKRSSLICQHFAMYSKTLECCKLWCFLTVCSNITLLNETRLFFSRLRTTHSFIPMVWFSWLYIN